MPSFHNELTSIGLILMFIAVLPLLFLSGQTDWAERSIWTAMMYVLLCVFLVGALLLFLGFYLTVKSNHSNTSSPSLFFLQSRLQEPQRTIIQRVVKEHAVTVGAMPSFHNELTSIGLILMFVAVLPLLFLSGQTDWAELSIWTAMMYVLLCVFLVGALLLFLGFYLTVKSNHSNTSSPSLFFLQSRLQEPQRTIIQRRLEDMRRTGIQRESVSRPCVSPRYTAHTLAMHQDLPPSYETVMKTMTGPSALQQSIANTA
ncbi:UNVERIFIED_CONTAM: hypothetical protein FKN15_071590 [Acipenser sinensis]